MTEARTGLAALPRIDVLVAQATTLVERYGRGVATDALREAVDGARPAVAAGGAPPSAADLIEVARGLLVKRSSQPLRPVINATGVIIHTNLGRAALSQAARDAMLDASGACDLEYDLEAGTRGSRTARLEPLLTAATGAEAGMVVNNAAAALVLTLSALALGREVLVSRGELVEIGGSFRLPDIMSAAGVRLVEVGTTNRTRAQDYEAGKDVGLLLKVHPSNYRIEGFTQEATVADLADVARRRGVPLVPDVGSGLLRPRREAWLAQEPSVEASLRAGAGLVVFSGDKLLGGPQAGVIVGSAELVGRCSRHPLARALRLDKLRIAALAATLEAHVRGTESELPVWQALTRDTATLRNRLEALAAATGASVVDANSIVGGGSAPAATIPTPVLRLGSTAAQQLAESLRRAETPIIVRVEHGAVWIDLRAVSPEDDGLLMQQLQRILGGPAGLAGER